MTRHRWPTGARLAPLALICLLLATGPLAAADPACTTDIDGNGQTLPATDGQLALRHLFGFTGTALTNGAVGPGATRATAAAITAWLNQPDCQRLLDIDGNGQRDALTDGVLLLRYLEGRRGEALVTGALGAGARMDAASIATDLDFASRPQTVRLDEAIPAGQTRELPTVQAEVRNTASTPVTVRVTEGSDAAGTPVIRVDTNGPLELNLPDPNAVGGLMAPGVTLLTPQAAGDNYPIIHRWDRGFALFARVGELLGYNRVPGARAGNLGPLSVLIPGGGIYHLITSRASFALYGACAASDTACLSNRDPVLFIHGYAMDNTLDPLGFALGGGADTWGDFPQLIQGAGLVPFEFRWNTAARFQDAAADLATAIRAIRATTGRRVHLVAHSFGGLLVRTLLQRYDLSDDYSDIGPMIGKVVTLGTPHAGVAYQRNCMHGVPFPKGRDGVGGFTIEGCGQLTCHMAGENMLGSLAARFYQVQDDPGELAAALANTTNRLPATELLVLIGLTTRRDGSNRIDPGDGLISYEGQRLVPGDSARNSASTGCTAAAVTTPTPLREAAVIGAARVTERVLGFATAVRPGDNNPEPQNGGYRHASLSNGGLPQPPTEAGVDCASDAGCTHAAWQQVRDWLLPTTPPPLTARPLNDTGLTWCADATRNNLPCPVAGYPWQDAQDGRDKTHNDDRDGHAGFSFTKLDANGRPLPASATTWSCVRDNVTGLTWEVKTDDGGLRDKDWTYSWYNPDPMTNGGFKGYPDYGDNCFNPARCDTHKFVADVNAVGLCGARDWRLPDRFALASIVDYSRYGPAIDTAWFPNTNSYGWFWSSSASASNPGNAWNVNFGYGYVNDYDRNYAYQVRLVRGGQ